MSVDNPLYCPDCGMSHRGHHAKREFCTACGFLMFLDDDQELVCEHRGCVRFGQGRETPARRAPRASK